MPENKLKVDSNLFNEFKKLRRSIIDDNGYEIPNPVPTDLDVGLRPPSLQEQIQRLVRNELSQQMATQGAETFEEANDFEMPEDEDPISPYVIHDMVEEEPLPPVNPDEVGQTEPEDPVPGPTEPEPSPEPGDAT